MHPSTKRRGSWMAPRDAGADADVQHLRRRLAFEYRRRRRVLLTNTGISSWVADVGKFRLRRGKLKLRSNIR